MGHLFISYSRLDRSKIDQLADRLGHANYDCWIDQEDMRSGDLWRDQIVKAIKNCDLFILALSPNSVQSRDVRKELDLAEDNKKRVLPVIIQPVEIPSVMAYQLAGIQYIDLTTDFETGIQSLLNDLSVPVSPTPTLPPQNIPRSGALAFIGRDQDLTRIHQTFQQQEQMAVYAISGMGGIGKTEIAIQYAQRYWQESYTGGVCWLRARGDNIGIQIVEFVQNQARAIGSQ